MKNPVIAIYPGTFDPITLGHEDVVRRASRLFDQVIVAVAVAHHKKTLFNVQERCDLVAQALSDSPNVRAMPFDGLIVEFAHQHGAQVMVRGVRSMTDFDYEFQLAGMNQRLRPQIDTVFFNTTAQQQCVSSTLVREIAMLGGDVGQFVSPPVFERIQKTISKK
jgi:pantetheine-phosphate adenylyltransferase